MLEPVTREFRDFSTPENFEFEFCCDRCGKHWRSESYPFDMKSFEPPVDERIRTMIWNYQHNEAYERANREAGVRFYRCPDCGCRICDDCLYGASLEKTEKCRGCADGKGF